MSSSSDNNKMISILNNDDNPSFAVRSTKTKHQVESLPYTQQKLRLWSTASTEYNPESTFLPSESPTFYHLDHGFAPSHGMTPSPEPSVYPHAPMSQVSSYPSISPRNGPSCPQGLGGLSIENNVQKDHHPGEPLSPQSTFNRIGDFKPPKVNKKNKYPCPYSASHSCSATFTTSGHAARHGKKHTGEKSVHCPVCNKAFTRKDNMKQHRRTHREFDSDKDAEGDVRSQFGINPKTSNNGSTTLSLPDMDVSVTPNTEQSRRHSSRSSTHSYGVTPRFDVNEVSGKLALGTSGRSPSAYRSDSLSHGLDSLAIANNNSNRAI